MLAGAFDAQVRPFIVGKVLNPQFSLSGPVAFLVDTGSDITSLHPRDGRELQIPWGGLGNPAFLSGIGGAQAYHTLDAYLVFDEAGRSFGYAIRLAVATPSRHNVTLPSLLGQDLLRNWRMVHDPTMHQLEFEVRRSDLMVGG